MQDNNSPILMWFRRDLRLADHPALSAAAASGRPVIPVFILDPETEGLGAAPKWRLGLGLEHFSKRLEGKGSRMVFRRGPALDVLRAVIEETGAGSVFWSRLYDSNAVSRDTEVKAALKADGVEARSFGGHLLFEPWTVQTGSGGPYKVYTPFWKNVDSGPAPDLPREAPETIPGPDQWPPSADLDALGLEPTRDWKDGLAEAFTTGEPAAQEKLETLLDDAIRSYQDDRNFPAKPGTSKLSPHLHHGEIGPRQCYHTARRFMADARRKLTADEKKQCETFIKEIFVDLVRHHRDVLQFAARISEANVDIGDIFPHSHRCNHSLTVQVGNIFVENVGDSAIRPRTDLHETLCRYAILCLFGQYHIPEQHISLPYLRLDGAGCF